MSDPRELAESQLDNSRAHIECVRRPDPDDLARELLSALDLLDAHREEFKAEYRRQFPDDDAAECLADFEAGARHAAERRATT